MESGCFWRRSRAIHILLLMSLYLPVVIKARSVPQAGSDFPMSSEALPLPSLELPLMEKDLQYGTVVAACTKHRIACHLLRGHAAGTLRASLSVDQYERGNDRMLESYSTQDYGYEHPDSNPATAIYVPVVASPLYSPYSGTATGHVPP